MAANAALFSASYWRAVAVSLRTLGNSEMSAPALKSRSPEPARMTARTFASPQSQWTASGIARHMAAVIAFLRAGFSMTRSPMPAWLAARIPPPANSHVRFILSGPFSLNRGWTI